MPKPYKNRELSWLQFNLRVLDEVTQNRNPEFERLRFLSIVHSNLDEFFMIRVGSLMDQNQVEPKLLDTKTQWTAQKQLDEVSKEIQFFYKEASTSFQHFNKALAIQNIHHLHASSLSHVEKQVLEESFDKDIAPLLSIQIVDAKHPFPHLNNKQIYGVLELERKNKKELGIITVNPLITPPLLFLPLNRVLKFMPIEDVVILFAQKLFKDWKILSKGLIRVTRNADIDVTESDEFEAEDFRSTLKSLLKKRLRMSPVRLESRYELSESVLGTLRKALVLPKEFCFSLNSPLDFSYVNGLETQLKNQSRLQLFYTPQVAISPQSLSAKDSILQHLIKHDVFFATPYQSFNSYLQFLSEASQDPKVFSIQITLYRVASESRILQSLIQAAEAGKEVIVLFELKARFDESNNIEWSKRLEEAGVRVIYGVNWYKVHSKVTLIKRKDGQKIQHFSHISTGNYNEKTARFYTDFHLLSANADIGLDVQKLFQILLTNTVNEQHTFKHLWVAPHQFSSQLIDMIHQEIELHQTFNNGKIILKLNSLTDIDLMEALIKASTAGVSVHLYVRGICCLIPAIKDQTENITIKSFVGRYLEHSRSFYFHHNKKHLLFISSADGMTRNLHRRIEVACPILDETQKQVLLSILFTYASDSNNAWIQDSKGQYTRLIDEHDVDAQKVLFTDLTSNPNTQEKSSDFSLLHWFSTMFTRET